MTATVNSPPRKRSKGPRLPFEHPARLLQLMVLTAGVGAVCGAALAADRAGRMEGIEVRGVSLAYYLAQLGALLLPTVWLQNVLANARRAQAELPADISRAGFPLLNSRRLGLALRFYDPRQSTLAWRTLTFAPPVLAACTIVNFLADLGTRTPAAVDIGLTGASSAAAGALMVLFVPAAHRVAARQEKEHRAQY